MKYGAIFAASVACATAQQFPTEMALRGMSKRKVVALHSRRILMSNATEIEKSFAQAFKAKASRDGVPKHVYDAVIHDLASGQVQGGFVKMSWKMKKWLEMTFFNPEMTW